jgi:hypothetical protein
MWLSGADRVVGLHAASRGLRIRPQVGITRSGAHSEDERRVAIRTFDTQPVLLLAAVRNSPGDLPDTIGFWMGLCLIAHATWSVE